MDTKALSKAQHSILHGDILISGGGRRQAWSWAEMSAKHLPGATQEASLAGFFFFFLDSGDACAGLLHGHIV